MATPTKKMTVPVCEMSFSCHGARVGVCFEEQLAFLRDSVLPLGSEFCEYKDLDDRFTVMVNNNRFELTTGDTLLFSTPSLREFVFEMESELAHSVAVHARDRLFVHAGVVGWRDRAIVIPGSSRSGKTTLIESLVREGAEYLSDEYALFDEDGLVHPYPRPLAVRSKDSRLRVRIPVNLFGGSVGRAPLPVGLLLITDYKPGCAFRPQTLTGGEALLQLLCHTVAARRSPRTSLRILRRVVTGGAVSVKTPRGDAQEASAAVLSLSESAIRTPGNEGCYASSPRISVMS